MHQETKYVIVKNDKHRHADFHTYYIAKVWYHPTGCPYKYEKSNLLEDMDIMGLLDKYNDLLDAFKSQNEDWQEFKFTTIKESVLDSLIFMGEIEGGKYS